MWDQETDCVSISYTSVSSGLKAAMFLLMCTENRGEPICGERRKCAETESRQPFISCSLVSETPHIPMRKSASRFVGLLVCFSTYVAQVNFYSLCSRNPNTVAAWLSALQLAAPALYCSFKLLKSKVEE